jgi:organic radical activating enzyme
MLIRITSMCQLKCSHCFQEHVSAAGEHMTPEVFGQALDFARRLGVTAILLSGGEPTLHPHIAEWIGKVKRAGFVPIVASNGMFAKDPKLTARLLKAAEDAPALIQVTNDYRYYSEPLPDSSVWQHPKVVVVDRVTMLRPCRRVKEKGYPTRNLHPSCFNIRSLNLHKGLEFALEVLEKQLMRFCVPAVAVDGGVHMGELDTCQRIGWVRQRIEDIETVVKSMRCNRCGLTREMSAQHKRAIGEV